MVKKRQQTKRTTNLIDNPTLSSVRELQLVLAVFSGRVAAAVALRALGGRLLHAVAPAAKHAGATAVASALRDERKSSPATILMLGPLVESVPRLVERGPRPGWHVRDVAAGFGRAALRKHVRH